MTWLRNAWYRLFTWVASWGRPVAQAQPQLNNGAQELVALARKVREKQWKQAPDPLRTNLIDADKYRKMLSEQMSDVEPVPNGVYRSATFRVCTDRLDANNEAQWQATQQRLSLKVEK